MQGWTQLLHNLKFVSTPDLPTTYMMTLPGVFDAHGGNDELHTGCVKEMFGSAALS